MIKQPANENSGAASSSKSERGKQKKKSKGKSCKQRVESKNLEAQRSLSLEGNGCCLPILGSSPRRSKPQTYANAKELSQIAQEQASTSHVIIKPNVDHSLVQNNEQSEQQSVKADASHESEVCSNQRQQTRASVTKKVSATVNRSQDDQMNKLKDLLDAFGRHRESSVIKHAKIKPRLSDSYQIVATMQLGERPPSPTFRSGTHLLTCGSDQPKGAQFYLEDNWRQFVRLPSSPISSRSVESGKYYDSQEGAEQEQTFDANNLEAQQNAIWELLTTEVSHMKRLEVVIDLFQGALERLQQNSLLNEVDWARLFGNINEVYEANRQFWTSHLLTMLTRARATGKPMDLRFLRSVVDEIRNIFKPYCEYCVELDNHKEYAKFLMGDNEYFKVYMMWCERQRDCDRLGFASLWTAPMQRLTRYPLMLKNIALNTDDPGQLECLEQLLDKMTEFLTEVDLKVKLRQDLDLLLKIHDQIEPFELPNELYGKEASFLVRNYCQMNLLCPLFNCEYGCQRQLLYSSHTLGCNPNFGQLKFKDPMTNCKLDIILILFTDKLLICKQSKGRRSQAITSPAKSAAWCRAQMRESTKPTMSELRQRTGSHSSANSVGGCSNEPIHPSPTNLASKLMVPDSNFQRTAASQSPPDLRETRRGEFARSNESSTDIQLDAAYSMTRAYRSTSKHSKSGNKSETCCKLELIRPPYPIESLKMMQLGDGQGVLCLQLHDDQTYSKSFCIYFNRKQQQQQANIGIGGGTITPTDSSGKGLNLSSDILLSREPREGLDFCDGLMFMKQATPANQFIRLISAAQILFYQSAKFHNMGKVQEIMNMPLHSTITQTRSNEEQRSARLQDHHRSRWSVHKRQGKNTSTKYQQLAATDSGSELLSAFDDDVDSQSRSVSCESCTGATLAQQDPIQELLAEQLKCMELNHNQSSAKTGGNQSLSSRVNSLSPPVRSSHLKRQTNKTASSPPCPSIIRTTPSYLTLNHRSTTAFVKSNRDGECRKQNVDMSEAGKLATSSYQRRDAASNDSSSNCASLVDEVLNNTTLSGNSASTNFEAAESRCKNYSDITFDRCATSSRNQPPNYGSKRHLSRQDINVTSMDQRPILTEQTTITNEDSESSIDKFDSKAESSQGKSKYKRPFLVGHNLSRLALDSSQGTADQITSAIFDSSCEQQDASQFQSIDNQQVVEPSYSKGWDSKCEENRAVSIESGNLADCESTINPHKKQVGKSASSLCYRSSYRFADPTGPANFRAGSVKNSRSPIVTLTAPDHHPSPISTSHGPSHVNSPTLLKIPYKQGRYLQGDEYSSAFCRYQQNLSPIDSLVCSPSSNSAVHIGSFNGAGLSIGNSGSGSLSALGVHGLFLAKQSSSADDIERSPSGASRKPVLSRTTSARSNHTDALPEFNLIASTSSSRSSKSIVQNQEYSGTAINITDKCREQETSSVNHLDRTGRRNDSLASSHLRPAIGFERKKERSLFQYLASIIPRLGRAKRFKLQGTWLDGIVDSSQNRSKDNQDCSSAPNSPVSLSSGHFCDDSELFEIFDDYSGSKTPPVYFGFHEKIRMYQDARSSNNMRTDQIIKSMRENASSRSISFGSSAGCNVVDKSTISDQSNKIP